jgi:hypothetical protein
MAFSSHFSDSGDYSDYHWETFMVLHPGPHFAPAFPGLPVHSCAPTFTDARQLALSVEARGRHLTATSNPSIPSGSLVVWVEGERDGSCFDGHPDAYESTTVCRETGQLSLLDYRSTTNLRTC